MKKICISKGWSMCAPGTNGWVSVDLPNDYAITLPRSAHVAGGASNGFFQGGIGRYAKDLELTDDRHYILDVDGAYMCTTVKLNGYQLVMHPHGYTPLLVDLTKRSKCGANKLEISTNALQPSTRWYAGAGIYRDVFLWEGGDIRIEPWDLFVSTPTTDTVNAACEISADRSTTVKLHADILDADGAVVVSDELDVDVTQGEKAAAALSLRLANAQLWDTESPYLYTMRVTVFEGDLLLDTAETTFGVRTISADARRGLLLNGRSLKLRGGCIHHDLSLIHI